MFRYKEQTMFKTFPAALRAALIGLAVLTIGGHALAQQQPSPAAIATAKKIIELKGGDNIFGPIIPGVIEQGKAMFEQQNPALGKDLATVAAKLRTEFQPKLADLDDHVARIYASHFTEQELTDILKFYSTPLGKKMINEEPKAFSDGINYAREWSSKLSDEVITRMRAEMKKMGHDI
jgi:hypothetical protein